MRKFYKLLVLMVIVAVSLSIFLFNVFANEPDIQPSELKNNMGIDIEVNNTKPNITREQAIETAKLAFGITNAKTVTAQTNIMTWQGFTDFSEQALSKNSVLKEKGYLDKSPVWIVSFRGLRITRSGGPNLTDEQRQSSFHQEENAVIDATTGEPLFIFTYR